LEAVVTFVRACIDELRRIVRDGGAVLILVAGPLVYALLYSVPYSREVLRDLPVCVVDEDRSGASRALIRMLDAHPALAVASRATAMNEAESQLRTRACLAIVVIPRGFSAHAKTARPASLGVFVDASYLLEYKQLLTGIVETARTAGAGIEIRRLEAAGMFEARAHDAREPVRLIARPLFNPAEGYATYAIPAVLVLILQQTLLVGIGLVRATANGVSRPPRVLDDLGRAFAYVVLYAVHATIAFAVFYRALRFPLYIGPALIAATALFLTATISLAFWLSRFFARRESSIPVLLFTSVPAMFVSGVVWPRDAMPPMVRWMSYAVPSTSGIRAITRAAAMDAPLNAIANELAVLALLTLVFAFLASIRTER
jgi:ABC-2 type transport system permease protein